MALQDLVCKVAATASSHIAARYIEKGSDET